MAKSYKSVNFLKRDRRKGKCHSTYVAEINLELNESASRIKHPVLEHFFSRFENGRYISDDRVNNWATPNILTHFERSTLDQERGHVGAQLCLPADHVEYEIDHDSCDRHVHPPRPRPLG
jgi:hypothetical protein